MIEIQNVTKRFANNVVAVNDVSLSFDKGMMYAIMGPSGSGKSTILNMIGGLETMSSGDIRINGVSVAKLSDKEKSRLRMNNIGYVFQGFYLNPYLNAIDNVIVPMQISPRYSNKQMKERATELINKVGLTERIKHYPKEMSGGEMQRVAIARALANDPSIILADEPTGNLDEQNEIIILDMLKDFAEKGKCVIVVSHNEIIRKYANKIIQINKGILVDE